MTEAVTDLWGDRDPKPVLFISLSVLVVVGIGIAWFTYAFVRDLWEGRADIAVDWDPEALPGQPFGTGRMPSPEGSRFVVRREGQMLIVNAADRSPLAGLGDVSEVAWVSEDVLVAFGTSIRGDFEGLAVIDLADQSVEQVDTDGRTDNGFRPLEPTAEGQVEVCEWIYDSAADSASCGPDRFFIDPTTAELLPA